MIFGVDYYPEHWDRKEWEAQARLMREGNFNTVRIAEFAWKIFEREEGVFDFTLMDEAIEILSKEGISVILGTPTAAPPKWLVNRYDVLLRDRYGRKREYGSRRECCANSKDYIKKSAIIVEEMAKHYQGNRNVIGWQIDNEFGCHGTTRCYCESCREAFAKWLRSRYDSIDELNRVWGNVFWSLDYDSFEDIILPAYNSCEDDHAKNYAHNPSLDLEYRRFASDSWVAYQNMQIDIIRKYSELPITHNMMGHFSDINYYDLGKRLDIVSWDNYPDNQWGDSEYEYVSMAHEIMRGIKDKNFIVMEEQAGPCGWDIVGHTPAPGQLRLWTYQAIAHGAEGMVYFRFRTALFGMEQYWYGVLDHDGIPRRRFFEIQRTGEELKRLSAYVEGAVGAYDAMIVKSYDNVWSHEIKGHCKDFNYEGTLYSYYKAMADMNIMVTMGNSSYEKYKVVYMPAYNVVAADEVSAIEEYVRNGGILVLSYRSGTRDEFNNMVPDTLPGVFANMAGIQVTEFDAPNRDINITGKVVGIAKVWCDIIKPISAKVISTYDSKYYKDEACITVNQFGKGKVYYVGCDLDESAMSELIKIVSDDALINYNILPQGVELIKRDSTMGEYYMILNHNEYPVEVDFTGYSVLEEGEFSGELDGYGVDIIKK